MVKKRPKIEIDEVREKVRQLLKRYDTVFGRTSKFIIRKIEEDGYEPRSLESISGICKEMDDVISLNTYSDGSRVKWRLKEVMDE